MRQRLAVLGKDGQEAADTVSIRLISNVEVGVRGGGGGVYLLNCT